MSRIRKRKGYNKGTVGILLIVVAFLVVMSVQIYKLKIKDAMYAEREQNLKDQLAAETQRAEELEEMELYIKSEDYIKDMANKLGLVFENEIIFRENDE